MRSQDATLSPQALTLVVVHALVSTRASGRAGCCGTILSGPSIRCRSVLSQDLRITGAPGGRGALGPPRGAAGPRKKKEDDVLERKKRNYSEGICLLRKVWTRPKSDFSQNLRILGLEIIFGDDARMILHGSFSRSSKTTLKNKKRHVRKFNKF